jgi:DDE superfamily endonuclease.
MAGNEKELVERIRDIYYKYYGIGRKHFWHHVETTEDDLVDSHMSHCRLEAVTLCRESHITQLSLSPQSSHKVQPLDRGLLGHLKRCMLMKLPNYTQPSWACSSTVTSASFSETPLQKLLK